jgi:DNA mismatch repair protein MutS
MNTLNNLTPAMQQYYDLKSHYEDCILFFRMGDFYEMFEEDAKIAHKILGIALTSRNKNAQTPTLLAGIPYHAKEKYLPLLIEA